jgi:hypothetical protein
MDSHRILHGPTEDRGHRRLLLRSIGVVLAVCACDGFCVSVALSERQKVEVRVLFTEETRIYVVGDSWAIRFGKGEIRRTPAAAAEDRWASIVLRVKLGTKKVDPLRYILGVSFSEDS